MKLDLHSKNLDLPTISIVRTTPSICEAELLGYKQCYMGISLDNPVFCGKSLQALLLWTVERFDKCLVIVGDHLSRFNGQILDGLDGDEAIEAALDLGDSFIRRTSDIFSQLSDGKVQLTRWKQHLESKEYKESRAVLGDLFASDADFRASIEKDAFAFVRRHTRRNHRLAVEMEDAIRLSCEYLLEEIAVFSALSEQGWNVELYPGPELSVLVDIAKGRYPNIPQGLKQRINVELKICKAC